VCRGCRRGRSFVAGESVIGGKASGRTVLRLVPLRPRDDRLTPLEVEDVLYKNQLHQYSSRFPLTHVEEVIV
jgi:hypothetical protein